MLKEVVTQPDVWHTALLLVPACRYRCAHPPLSQQVAKGVHISSCAEDCFFVARDRVLERAMSTLSEQAVLAICSRVVESLDTSAAEPSLFAAVSSLPTTPCRDAALLREAVGAFQSYRNATAAGGAGEGERSLSDRMHSLALEAARLVDEDQMLDEVSGLVSHIIAANSADACAVSLEHLVEFMGDAVAHGSFLSPDLGSKLAATSVADLQRVSLGYSSLRVEMVQSLVASLEPGFAALAAGIADLTWALDASGRPLAPPPDSEGPANPSLLGGKVWGCVQRQ